MGDSKNIESIEINLNSTGSSNSYSSDNVENSSLENNNLFKGETVKFACAIGLPNYDNDENHLLSDGEKDHIDQNIGLPTLNLIIEKIGYSTYHVLLIFTCGFIYFSEGCQVYIINLLSNDITKYFSTDTHSSKEFLSSSIFFGFLIGCLLVGVSTSYLARNNPIKICLCIFLILSFLIVIIPIFALFIIIRIIIGICLGIMCPQIITNLSEILPTHYREVVILVAYIFYRLGIVYFILCFILLSKYTTWKVIMLLGSFPVLVAIILCFLFLKNSPKLLFIQNKFQNGLTNLKEIAAYKNIQITQNEEELLKEEVIAHAEIDNKTPLMALITDSYHRKVLILCIFIFTCSSMINMINLYALPLIKFLNKDHNDMTILYEIILSQLVTIPAIILSGFFSTISNVGKKITIITGLVTCFFVSLIPLFYHDALILCSSIVNFFVVFSYCSTKVYILENFPTKYKDYAISICYFFAKVGDALSPLICDLIYHYYIYSPLGIISVIALIGLIAAIILPVENSGD